MMAHEDKRRVASRRWLQFSFRSLMVFVVCLAVALSWYNSKGRRMAEGILKVQMLGGTTKLEELPNAAWQRWLLGHKHFVRAREVDLAERGVTDSDLSRVVDLAGVRLLVLSGNPEITDRRCF